jgi:hypothetical protein
MSARDSVYERRELGWRDRLRSLFRQEEPPAPLCDPPRLVVEGGRPVRPQPQRHAG